MYRAKLNAAFLIGIMLATGALAADSPAKEAGVGEMCLGIAGVACAKGLFCETDPGQCKTADVSGKCEKIPEICTKDYMPVCGCDGKTYGNDCERKAAGARLDHAGECK